MDASISPATSHIYKRCLSRYNQFVQLVGYSSGTIDNKLVRLWLAHLNKQGLAYGTICSHLSAIKHWCKKQDLHINLNSPRIALILKGIKKTKGAALNMKKKGVATPSHIRRLWSTASILGKSKHRFRTMVVTAFYGFLRPSELCVSKAGHYLTQDSVKIGRNKHSISLTLRTFKHSTVAATIKLKKERSGCCPVATMEKYIRSVFPPEPKAPLFNLTTNEFRDELSRVCTAAKIRTKLTPHSFRHGGATWAASRGWPDSRIRAHGRWRSNAFLRYVRA